MVAFGAYIALNYKKLSGGSGCCPLSNPWGSERLYSSVSKFLRRFPEGEGFRWPVTWLGNPGWPLGPGLWLLALLAGPGPVLYVVWSWSSFSSSSNLFRRLPWLNFIWSGDNTYSCCWLFLPFLMVVYNYKSFFWKNLFSLRFIVDWMPLKPPEGTPVPGWRLSSASGPPRPPALFRILRLLWAKDSSY